MPTNNSSTRCPIPEQAKYVFLYCRCLSSTCRRLRELDSVLDCELLSLGAGDLSGADQVGLVAHQDDGPALQHVGLTQVPQLSGDKV